MLIHRVFGKCNFAFERGTNKLFFRCALSCLRRRMLPTQTIFMLACTISGPYYK